MQPNLNSQAIKLFEHNATLSAVPYLLNAALFLCSSLLSIIAIAAAAETPSQIYADPSSQMNAEPSSQMNAEPEKEALQIEIPVLGIDRIYGESKPAFVQNELELEDLSNKQWTRVEQRTDLMIDPEALIEQTALYQQLAKSLQRQQQSARHEHNSESYIRSATPHIVRLPSMPLLRDLATSQTQDPETLQRQATIKQESALQLANNSNSVSIINPLFSDLNTGFADTPDPKLALAQLSQKAQTQQLMQNSAEGMGDSSIPAKLNVDALSNDAALAYEVSLDHASDSSYAVALAQGTNLAQPSTLAQNSGQAKNSSSSKSSSYAANSAYADNSTQVSALVHNDPASQAVLSERNALAAKNATLQHLKGKGELTSASNSHILAPSERSHMEAQVEHSMVSANRNIVVDGQNRDSYNVQSGASSQMRVERSSKYYNLNQSNMSYMAQTLEQARYLSAQRTTFAPVSSWSNPFFAQSLAAPRSVQVSTVISTNTHDGNHVERMRSGDGGNYATPTSGLAMREALAESLQQQDHTSWNAQAYTFRRDDAQTATGRQLTAALNNSGRPLVSSLVSGSAMLGNAYPMAFSNRRPSNHTLKSVVIAAANSSLAMSVEHQSNPNYSVQSAYSTVSTAVLNATQNQNITTTSSMMDAHRDTNLAVNNLSSTGFASSSTSSSASMQSNMHASVNFNVRRTKRSAWTDSNQYQHAQNQNNTLLSSNYGSNTNDLSGVDAITNVVTASVTTGLNTNLVADTAVSSNVDGTTSNLEGAVTLAGGANVALGVTTSTVGVVSNGETSSNASLALTGDDVTSTISSNTVDGSLAAADLSEGSSNLASSSTNSTLDSTSNSALNATDNGVLTNVAGDSSLTGTLTDDTSNSLLASQTDSQLNGDVTDRLSGSLTQGSSLEPNKTLNISESASNTSGNASDGQTLATTTGDSTDSSTSGIAGSNTTANSATTSNNNGTTDDSLSANDSDNAGNADNSNGELANENESNAAEQDSTLAATTESSLNNNKAESNVSSSALANKEEANTPNEIMSQKLEKASRLGLYGGGAQAALMAGNSTIDLIYSRMGLRSLPDNIQPYAAQPSEPDVWLHPNGVEVWVSPVYRHRDATALQFNNSSYGADINLYGLAVGADYTFERAFSVGMVFNMGAGDATGKGASQGISNDFDYYGGAIYGGCRFDSFSLLGDITYTKVDNQFDSVADFEHITASMNSEHFSVGVTGQYEFKVNPRFSVIPHAGLRYNNIELKDYNIESLSDRIVYDMDSLKFISLPAGVTFTQIYQSSEWLIQPAADFTVTFNMLDTAIQGDIIWDTPRRHRFKMRSEVIEEFTWRTTFGIAASCKNFNLGLNISYTGSADSHEYGLMGSVHWKF